MKTKITDVRYTEGALLLREAPATEGGEPSRTIEGTAIVFNTPSAVLDDLGEPFREIILPEACDAAFLKTQDIKLNLLHDRALTVARCNKGEGSLTLRLTDDGLSFSFDAPRCDLGDRVLEMVRRGDYSGCSFEFIPGDYEIEENPGKEAPLFTVKHKRFRALLALTIGMDPAYIQTSVSAREAFAATHPASAADAGEALFAARKRQAAARCNMRRRAARDDYFDFIVNP